MSEHEGRRSTRTTFPTFEPAQLAMLERAGGVRGELDRELVHERFERIAAAQPEVLAVRHGGLALRYGELDQRATKLAHHLRVVGAAERPVAVCLRPSLDVLVALLAIMKAGAIYVPLDPTHPAALRAQVIDEVEPALLLTTSDQRPTFSSELATLSLDRDALETRPVQVATRCAALESACYVLYTSGTTGRPKGVVATHANLAHYLGVARRRYRFAANDVFCSIARYTFSISFFELLSPLTCGGSLVLLERDDVLDPERLSRAIAGVTVLHAGPSLLEALARHADRSTPARAFPEVRHASSGGDSVPPALMERMKTLFPHAELFVIYGCTEIACMGCTAEIDRDRQADRTRVGLPFENVSIRLLDPRQRLVEPGELGEVYIGGPGLARRYLERPELSSEKFVCLDGQRFYRTGDLGRLDADGQLELLGRSDFQVQLRGMRVELLGIEHTVRRLELAAQCIVVAQRPEGGARLVAYLVEPRVADAATVRRALAAELPDYMVPEAYVVLQALPLTPNGKVDRRALIDLAPSAKLWRGAERLFRAPEGALEQLVAESFASVLGVSHVDRGADFFALGGHSLWVVRVAELLSDRLGRAISPSLIFAHTTVHTLAAALEQPATTNGGPLLLNADGSLPGLFMLLGVQLYREFAQALAGRFAVYGLYAASELALFRDGRCSVDELARDYVRMIRDKQPHGPYRLGGMSFGGIVAFEVAQQLTAAGEEVELLLLLDSVLPETRLARMRRLLGSCTLSELASALRGRLVPRAAHDTSFSAHMDDPSLRSLEELRQGAYRRAALDYLRTSVPHEGDVTLITAQERLARDRSLDPCCGFGALAPNLTVHTLPCGHLGLLQGEAVRAVARIALESLRRPGARACVVPSLQVA